MWRIGTRLWMTILAFAVAAGLYLAAPPAHRAAASDCGAHSGSLCSKTSECATFIFYKICTERYKYYPAAPTIVEVG